MTHSKQAAKRVRQNEKRRLRNKARGSAAKSAVKRAVAAAEAGDVAKLEGELAKTLATVDKAAKRNVIHKNTAARRKSRVMRALAKAKAKPKA